MRTLIPLALLLAAGTTAHAQHVWTGNAGNNEWCTPNNWNPPSVPSGAAIIPADINGRVSFADNCTPTFSSLTASGPVIFDGAVRNSGPIIASDIIISSGNFTIGPLSPGGASLNFVNTANWRNGIIANQQVVVQNGALLRIDTGSHTLRDATLRNDGSVTLQTALTLNGEAAIENNSTWTLSAGGTLLQRVGTTGRFSNTGTLTTDIAGATATIAIPFDNSGTIQVFSGTLELGPGVHDGGQISVSPGQTVNLSGTPATTFQNANQLSGDGSVIVTNGLLDLRGNTLIALDASGTHDGGFVLDNAGGLIASGPDGEIVNAGLFRWQRGGILGSPRATLRNQGRFVATANSATLTAMTVPNEGTFVLDLPAGSQLFLSDTSINNAPGSTFEFRGGFLRPTPGSDPFETLIIHRGLLTKVSPLDAGIVVPIEIHPGARVEVREGILNLDDRSERSFTSGTIAVNALNLSQLRGTLRAGIGALFEGGGEFRIPGPGGLLVVEGDANNGPLNAMNGTGDAFHLSGGRIDGPGYLGNSGKLVVSGSTIGPASGASGSLIVFNSGFMTIRNSTLRLAATLTNGLVGDLAIESSISMAPGAQLQNYGEITIGESLGISALPGNPQPSITNFPTATIRKIELGFSTISVPLDNNGEIRVQQGTLTINGPIAQLVDTPEGRALVGGTWTIQNNLEIAATLSFGGRPFNIVGGDARIRDLGDFPDFQPNLIRNESYTEFGAYTEFTETVVVDDSAEVLVDLGGFLVGVPTEDIFMLFFGGTALKGSGTVDMPVQVNDSARIAPGTSPGTLTLGALQMNGGILDIEVAGLTPGTQHDRLVITGSATLGGTLRLTFLDGFQPAPGDAITILTAQSIGGAFQTIEPPADLNPTLRARVVFTPSTVEVRFVCPADFNADAQINSDDLADFITAYFNIPPDAASDFNSDGIINSDDLSDYITAYFNGCA